MYHGDRPEKRKVRRSPYERLELPHDVRKDLVKYGERCSPIVYLLVLNPLPSVTTSSPLRGTQSSCQAEKVGFFVSMGL